MHPQTGGFLFVGVLVLLAIASCNFPDEKAVKTAATEKTAYGVLECRNNLVVVEVKHDKYIETIPATANGIQLTCK